MKQEWSGCLALEKLRRWDTQLCCSSCHDDAAEGYYGGEMCWSKHDDKEYHVCCAALEHCDDFFGDNATVSVPAGVKT